MLIGGCSGITQVITDTVGGLAKARGDTIAMDGKPGHYTGHQSRHHAANTRYEKNEGRYWYKRRQIKKAQKKRIEGRPAKPGGGKGVAPPQKAVWRRTRDFNNT